MLTITFVHVSIRNFNSWKYLEFPLSDQGTVCLRGLTGSGKSSLFKAIYWCLFGSTPDAIRADEVRGSRKPTRVALKLHKGDHTYKITRHRGHPILKNKVEFEGYGVPRTDEDSLIKDVQSLIDNFLGISSSVFLTTTFFAQRNFHIFHSLSDTGKKEWLESITYGSLFPECETLVRAKTRELERNISYAEGKLIGLHDSLKVIENSNTIKVDELSLKIKKLKSERNCLCAELDSLNENLRILKFTPADYRHAKDAVSQAEIRLNIARAALSEAQSMSDRCVTCGSKISLQTMEGAKKEAISAVKIAKSFLHDCREKLKNLRLQLDAYEGLQEKIEHLDEKIRTNRQETLFMEQELSQIDNSSEIILAIKETENTIRDHKKKFEYFKFWLHGFGFQGLRTYVLQTAANLLLTKLQSYLLQISGDSIKVDLEFVNNKILLSFNNRSYGSLSGGERQSVDICTGFALRDVAESYNKCRFNLIILDEPFEGLDDYLTAKAQTLLLDNPKDSTFFITHRAINTRFDKYVVVRKDKHSKMKVVYG